MIFFTADTHFGHRNIIPYCNRPFPDVETMDQQLILRWNAVVRPNDVVYHLGDFSFHPNKSSVENTLVRLNGNKILIKGNHDRRQTRNAKHWHAVFEELTAHIQGTTFVLRHHPLDEADIPPHIVHLHGHTHGELPSIPGRRDVGVDANDYSPIPITEFLIK